MKKIILIILIVCIVIAGVILGLGGLAIYFSYRQSALLSKPPLHGTSFVIEADFSRAHGDTNMLANLKEVERQRFSRFGTRIYWEPISETRIRIITPITDNQLARAAKSIVSRGGYLEFRMVHRESDKLIESGEIPPGFEVLKREESQDNGQKRIDKVVVKKTPEHGLASNMVETAMVVRGNLGEPQLDFKLNKDATAAFAEITRENVGQRLAIVLDGELYSAPRINSPIETGSGQLTGRFDMKEVSQLAIILECPLPVPITVLESNTF